MSDLDPLPITPSIITFLKIFLNKNLFFFFKFVNFSNLKWFTRRRAYNKQTSLPALTLVSSYIPFENIIKKMRWKLKKKIWSLLQQHCHIRVVFKVSNINIHGAHLRAVHVIVMHEFAHWIRGSVKVSTKKSWGFLVKSSIKRVQKQVVSRVQAACVISIRSGLTCYCRPIRSKPFHLSNIWLICPITKRMVKSTPFFIPT